MNKNIRTDLAIEVYEELNKVESEQSFGDTGVEVEHLENNEIKITRVKVNTKEGEETIGKPIGNYITLDYNKGK